MLHRFVIPLAILSLAAYSAAVHFVFADYDAVANEDVCTYPSPETNANPDTTRFVSCSGFL
jgi:hypothetical protein